MRIGIIGAGRMGSGLGRAWVAAGHEVMFSYAREEQRLARLAEELGAAARVGSPADAAGFGEVVMLAVPWASVEDALAQAGPLDGVTLIECVNPLSADMTSLEVGHTTSASEHVSALASGARVVKAFNSVFAELLHEPRGWVDGDRPTVFYAGDDADAKATAARLIEACGFEAVDAGPQRNARYIEPMGMLFIQLAYGQGLGPTIAAKLLRVGA